MCSICAGSTGDCCKACFRLCRVEVQGATVLVWCTARASVMVAVCAAVMCWRVLVILLALHSCWLICVSRPRPGEGRVRVRGMWSEPPTWSRVVYSLGWVGGRVSRMSSIRLLHEASGISRKRWKVCCLGVGCGAVGDPWWVRWCVCTHVWCWVSWLSMVRVWS